MKKLSFLAFSIFLAVPVFAADYYIDNVAGSDVTGNGSSGNPYASIKVAQDVSSSGVADNFYIKNTGTTYTDTAPGGAVWLFKSGLDENNPDVYQPWQGFDTPRLKAIHISRSSGNEATYCTIRGFFIYPGANETTNCLGSGGGGYDARYLTFEDCEIRGGQKSYAFYLMTNGAANVGDYSNLTVKNCYIHARLSDSSTRRPVFYAKNLISGGILKLHNMKIQDSTIMYESGFGSGFRASHLIDFADTNVLTANTEITGTYISANYTVNKAAGANYNAGTNSGMRMFRIFGDFVFQNNILEDTGYDGAYLACLDSATTTFTIKNNIFKKCVLDGSSNRGALRVQPGDGTTVDVSFNTLADNGPAAVGFRWSNPADPKVSDLTFAHNVVANNPTAINIGATAVINEYSNCFYNNPTVFSDSRAADASDVTGDPVLDSSYNLGVASSCIDAATQTSAALDIWEGDYSWAGSLLSTQADDTPDTGNADLGYHHKGSFPVPTPTKSTGVSSSQWNSYE